MTHFSAKERALFVVCSSVLLIALACSGLAGGSDTGPDTPEITIEQEITFGSGSFDFPDPGAGLADLSSYAATLSVSFDGTHDGQAQSWSREYSMLATNDPRARQWTIEQVGDLPTSGTVLRAEMDDLVYEKRGQAACLATAINEANALSEHLELAAQLSGVIGAEQAGAENVNDIATNHYTFDQRALGEAGNSQSTGELWVAQDGGYLVRYLLTTEAGSSYFGEGIEGTLSLDYQLSSPNGAPAIALPEDCPPGLLDVPRLPEATDIQSAPAALSYEAPASVADAAAFYEQQLPPLGWAPPGVPVISDTSAVLNYTRGDETMIITIEAVDSGSSVTIFVGKNQGASE